jgi:hypothetical protein
MTYPTAYYPHESSNDVEAGRPPEQAVEKTAFAFAGTDSWLSAAAKDSHDAGKRTIEATRPRFPPVLPIATTCPTPTVTNGPTSPALVSTQDFVSPLQVGAPAFFAALAILMACAQRVAIIRRRVLKTRNSCELVNHIRSGRAKLVLDKPLHFRDFSEFLQALKSSEKIRTVKCGTHRVLGITEDEWVLLVKTIGRIKDIQHLEFYCKPGSRDFHPFQAVADAINSASSLRVLKVAVDGETFFFPSAFFFHQG